VTETVSWGVLYYTFPVLIRPMERDLGWSRSETAAAFSIGLVTSALAAPAVGRWLDRGSPRLLMTAGSCLAAALLLAWSHVQGLRALYVIWAGLGLSMAAVLYEPAFAVLTAHFHGQRDRALVTLTLFGGLASTIFVPLATWLTLRLGWRSCLTALAAVLGTLTIPIHALLPGRPGDSPRGAPRPAGMSLRAALRVPRFWLLAASFVLAGLGTAAVGVHLIPCLLERGRSAGAAAAVVAAIGAMQLPGRLAFAPVRGKVPEAWIMAGVFLVQGLALVVLAFASSAGALAVFVLCYGAGNGLLTLARATSVADLFGTAEYASVAGVLSSMTTGARAAGPLVAAALYEGAGGYRPAFILLAALLGVAAIAAHQAFDGGPISPGATWPGCRSRTASRERPARTSP
jgi:MFS family permease